MASLKHIIGPISGNAKFCFFSFQSKYKSLLISERTTVDQVIQLVLNCYNSAESVNLFSIYEVRSLNTH